jgi:hypothetical protein
LCIQGRQIQTPFRWRIKFTRYAPFGVHPGIQHIGTMKFFTLIFFATFTLCAQTNDLKGNQPAANIQSSPPPASRRSAQISTCVQGRRRICGKILKVLPGGLVVDSGYTDLMRPALSKLWLIPGRVSASRSPNLVESCEPESICVGVIFLMDPPRSRGGGPKPRSYDYVNLLGYPAGEFTYSSVGSVHRTVRRFSADLLKAVALNLKALDKSSGAASIGTN